MNKYTVNNLIDDLKLLTDEQRELEVGLFNEEFGCFSAGCPITVDVDAKVSVPGPNYIGTATRRIVGLS